WTDEPASRGGAVIVLALFVLATAGFVWANPNVRVAVFAIGLAAAAASVGLAWVLPNAPGHRVHALRLDLGPIGGKRIEAAAILAGPTGFRGSVRWTGDGGYVRF